MSAPISRGGPPAAPPQARAGLGRADTLAPANRSRPDPSGEDRLLAASRDLEGVFMHHLVKAMRATVPNGGRPDAPGSDVYGAMLDDHLAQVVARDTSSGIAEAIYRQLTGRTHDPTPKVE